MSFCSIWLKQASSFLQTPNVSLISRLIYTSVLLPIILLSVLFTFLWQGWCSTACYCQGYDKKEKDWVSRKHQMKRQRKAKKSSTAEFHLSLNKQPCLSAVCIREAERAQHCRGFSCFSFLQRSGGSESGRDKRATTDSGEEEGGERAGLREFAGSLVYSLVVLTSEWTPADTERWRLAHVDVETL